MIGFVHNLTDTGSMDAHKITCFYAEKDQKNLYENQVGKPLNFTQINRSSDYENDQYVQIDSKSEAK